MEYEIKDDEARPAQASHPSLNDEIEKSIENQAVVTPGQYPKEERRQQKALNIPEEEDEDEGAPEA